MWYLIVSIPDLCTITYFDAQAIRAIRRGVVKCYGEMAYLLRIALALFGHSCNKYLILIDRCVTDVYHVKTQINFDHRRILTSAFNACADITFQDGPGLCFCPEFQFGVWS